MNFQDILKADIAHYERLHDQSLPQPEKDQTTKTDVDFQRKELIGEFFMEYFPEAKCFRPQLKKGANKDEFKLFADFLEKISKSNIVKKAWSKTVESKQAMSKTIRSGEENGDDL